MKHSYEQKKLLTVLSVHDPFQKAIGITFNVKLCYHVSTFAVAKCEVDALSITFDTSTMSRSTHLSDLLTHKSEYPEV